MSEGEAVPAWGDIKYERDEARARAHRERARAREFERERDEARAEAHKLRNALRQTAAEETWLYDDPGSANPPVRLGGKTMRARIRNIVADALYPEEVEP